MAVASNGEQAVEFFRKQPFDAILMDVQMPVLGGFDATRTIREEEYAFSLARTPIIGLTAHALEGDRQRCLDSGMDDYLAKPFRALDLLPKIRQLTGREPSLPQDVQHEPAPLGTVPVLEDV